MHIIEEFVVLGKLIEPKTKAEVHWRKGSHNLGGSES